MKLSSILILIIVLGIGILLFVRQQKSFLIPRGESVPLDEVNKEIEDKKIEENIMNETKNTPISTRKVFVTDGVKHSILLDEIKEGGPPKDGIPSIDSPKFISTGEADVFLDDRNSFGLGLVIGGEARFYPYQILVWHEIVNDTIQGEPILVTYCPLCGTGVVFERRVKGAQQEFGVSGKLWQSNLLMYNRAPNKADESLWSQVLGEAVLGVETGERLNILPADTVRYGDWKVAHPDTKVLSRDTGSLRNYDRDPYGDYYTEEGLYFPVTNKDERLFEKDFVLGIEIDNKFKAYLERSIPVGTITDTFAGNTLSITKNKSGVVTITDKEGVVIPHLDGFWFSWVSVHPETEVYK